MHQTTKTNSIATLDPKFYTWWERQINMESHDYRMALTLVIHQNTVFPLYSQSQLDSGMELCISSTNTGRLGEQSGNEQTIKRSLIINIKPCSRFF